MKEWIYSASEGATAVCLSMEPPFSPPPSSNLLFGGGSPAIDRYNPIIRDARRSAAAKPLPPLTPKKKLPAKQNGGQSNAGFKEIVKRNGRSCSKPADVISPPGSTRYLLSEKVLLNALSDFDPPGLNHLFPAETSKAKGVEETEPAHANPPSSSSSAVAVDQAWFIQLFVVYFGVIIKFINSGSSLIVQVVVLRVSLHCRGCERKMRKHISRMEGVRSFNIDFAAKKVTVSGNVTPLEVLSSISKVKNAQLLGPIISEFKEPADAPAAAADHGTFPGFAS